MDQWQLIELQKKLKISPVEIIREEKEVLILDILSKSKIGKDLIFKGGTALRLVYGSPRFSQDLDFSQKRAFSFADFKKTIKEITSIDNECLIKDIYEKRKTFFTLILVKNQLLRQNFSIKIEISKRDPAYKKEDFNLKVIKSPVSILTPLVYTASLERILFEKRIAIKTRREPRDYFDLWWLKEKLGDKIKIPKPSINKNQFKGEINQLLPDYLKNWADEFLKNYERS